MNLRKLIYFTIIFIFTVSNTGLPLAYHFCNSLQKGNFSKCGMCEIHSEKSKDDDLSLKTTIKSDFNCCDSKIFVEKSSENFLSLKNDFKVEFTDLIISNLNCDDDLEQNNIYTNIEINTSPPSEKEIPIFLLNSVFLN